MYVKGMVKMNISGRCILAVFVIIAISCNSGKDIENPFLKENFKPSLKLIAESQYRWTGISVSQEGRMFVCFPRWSRQVPVSVGEIVNGEVKPYPDKDWNNWIDGEADANKFICVQSVYVDDENYLWILDPASPYLRGVVPEGARIYKFDLRNNSLIRTYFIPHGVAAGKSYLNDIRVDTKSETAYITESGLGAIIVVNLKTGNSLRRLANHYSTKAELDSITVEGNSIKLKIHADGIALSPDMKHLYYQSLSGRHLYKVPAKELGDTSITDELIERKVEPVAEVGVNDGILGDRFGNIFLTGLESNSINLLNTKNKLIQIIKDQQIQWPDTFTMDSDGNVYFTVAQLHLPPDPDNLYKIFKIVFEY
jgi:sugar lactone lactonase YvrE